MSLGQADVDLSHIQWYLPEFIYSLPTKTLSTPEEAMDYFALSPFFDVRSNNSTLRITEHDQPRTIRLLTQFKNGFEFVIGHMVPPDLFVIHKREIKDGKRDNVTGIWFILEGKVYPSPSVYDAMAARLKNASYLVSSTFASLSSQHPPSNPRAHSTWRSLPPDAPPTQAADAQPSSGETDPTSAHTSDEATGPNLALPNALQATRTAMPDLLQLAQTPAPRQEPSDELKRLEDEILGSPGSGGNAAGGGTTNAAKSVKSASIAPAGLARERSVVGTPAFRWMSGKEPGVPASSPFTSQYGA